MTIQKNDTNKLCISANTYEHKESCIIFCTNKLFICNTLDKNITVLLIIIPNIIPHIPQIKFLIIMIYKLSIGLYTLYLDI